MSPEAGDGNVGGRQLEDNAHRTIVAIRHLQDLLRRLLSRKNVRHAIIAVESDDGNFRWCGAGGDATPDGTPMREDVPFHIASIDKMYTASVVLRLHERDHIGLDEPIRSYLPRSMVAGLHRFRGVDYSDAITIRHLLGHTSGLADCLEDRPKGGRSLMEHLFSQGDMAFTIDDLARIVRDDLVPHFPPQPVDAPRQRVRYSDTNYQLLIAIVEAVTGQRLHRSFEEMILAPLGLRHTHMFGYSRPLEPTPEPAAVLFDGEPLDIPLALRSFPSVYSTASDCLTFMRALTRGQLFDDPATFALMQQRWNRFGFPFDAVALRSPGWPVEYGLGLMHFRLPRIFNSLHRMPAVIGHTGSTGCWLFHCPQLGLLLCGTVDEASAGAVPYRFVPKLLRVLSGHHALSPKSSRTG